MCNGSRLWQEVSRRFIKVSSFSKGHEVESASRQNSRASFACHDRYQSHRDNMTNENGEDAAFWIPFFGVW